MKTDYGSVSKWANDLGLVVMISRTRNHKGKKKVTYILSRNGKSVAESLTGWKDCIDSYINDQ